MNVGLTIYMKGKYPDESQGRRPKAHVHQNEGGNVPPISTRPLLLLAPRNAAGRTVKTGPATVHGDDACFLQSKI